MAQSEFPLPDVGEGLTEAEIVSWKVKPGDTVTVNQVLVEIETAKSLVELPSPFAGTVTELLVEEGHDRRGRHADHPRRLGGRHDRAAGSGRRRHHRRGRAHRDTQPPSGPSSMPPRRPTSGSGAVLVGYGIEGRPRDDPPPPHGRARRIDRRPAGGGGQAGRAPRPASVPAASASPVIAKPPIRKLAKDLGVDLAEVDRHRPRGRDHARRRHPAGVAGERVPQHRDAGVGRRARGASIPVKGVRKAIATAMVSSAFTAPHVSVFIDVDATRTMEFVKRLKASPDFAGVRVSPLLVMAKAVIWAVRRNPTVNSSWTDKEIIVHHYVNLGIAAATPRGLIVPNIKDAQDLCLLELAQALEQLTITARDGKTQPADMANGTITITNIGSFGMDTGTPILNPGEVGIVALGTIKQKPWVVDGEVRPRFVTTVGAQLRPPRGRRRRRQPLHGGRRERARGAGAAARLTDA